ncbi:hypothetical protein ABT324_27570, partial [Saccharopolyspora sp. NPDC000359]|uniref:hypothetical protein n=1 Tax=Saccharopolyspora sp. NPDC000359 TaxID=3154251 RepID=UPI003327F3BB
TLTRAPLGPYQVQAATAAARVALLPRARRVPLGLRAWPREPVLPVRQPVAPLALRVVQPVARPERPVAPLPVV